RHTRWPRDWSSDVCSSDLAPDMLTNSCGSAYCETEFRISVLLRKWSKTVLVRVSFITHAQSTDGIPARCRGAQHLLRCLIVAHIAGMLTTEIHSVQVRAKINDDEREPKSSGTHLWSSAN